MLDYFSTHPHKKLLCAVFFISSALLMFIYNNVIIVKCSVFVTKSKPTDTPNDSNYLVYSTKCQIPNLDPFNPEAKRFYHPETYKNCNKYNLLTYVTKIDNIAKLRVNNELVPSYTRNGVNCCYSNVTRKYNKNTPDDHIDISKCENFVNETRIDADAIMVHCKDAKTKKEVYVNTHAIIQTKINSKLDNIEQNSTDIFNVLFVGIDSISRLNLIRTLPRTYQYLEDNNWVPLKGYNKIDDNTFPNLMAILTGYNESYAYKVCNPRVKDRLDHCPILWYDYRRLGYITAYAEDESKINTFNYRKKGFTQPPTDYYLRPYIIASEYLKIVHKDGMSYCTGPETSGERILNVARDFVTTLNNVPNFGFFWMNTFSHNELNSASGMDLKIRRFLSDLNINGILNNTIVVFLSDHGIRFGSIRNTYTGWLEERLPFIYWSIPPRFQMKFPQLYQNLKENSYKLTTPYDVHITLQHILQLSGFNYTIKASNACPLCDSLFTRLPQERSCQEAGIEQHWCTCNNFNPIEPNNQTVLNGIKFALKEIERKIKNTSICAKFKLNKVISSSISNLIESPTNQTGDIYLLVMFETKPKAVFESTLKIHGANLTTTNNFQLSGAISRLDRYSAHSQCIDDANLKKYCYCR